MRSFIYVGKDDLLEKKMEVLKVLNEMAVFNDKEEVNYVISSINELLKFVYIDASYCF